MSRMSRFITAAPAACLAMTLAACAPDYSPDVYNANAVQQANKVESGFVIGYRQVKISANGTVGAVTGGAAGGVLGAQVDSGGITTALGAVGGTFIGGIVGTTVEHVAGDTMGWEYIVRKSNGDLLSVTQREESPLPIGQKVLVIYGNQARVVADYSKPWEAPKAELDQSKDKDKEKSKDAATDKAAKTDAPSPTATSDDKKPAPAAPVPATATPAAAADKQASPAMAAPAADAAAVPGGEAKASAPPTALTAPAAAPSLAETPPAAAPETAGTAASTTPAAKATAGDSTAKPATP